MDLLADSQSAICIVAGGVVTDFDGDGMLDLILSHGESMAQPLSVFRGNQVCTDLGTHGAQPDVLPWTQGGQGKMSPGYMTGNGCPEAWKKQINSQQHSKPPKRSPSMEKPSAALSSTDSSPKTVFPKSIGFPSSFSVLSFQTSANLSALLTFPACFLLLSLSSALFLFFLFLPLSLSYPPSLLPLPTPLMPILSSSPPTGLQ